MKTAIITGITGQDGAYLAEFLLNKGYTVYGTFRRAASANFWRIEELGIRNNPNLHLVEHDITDFSSTLRLLENAKPDEVYNLAAQSFVGASFNQPILTTEINGISVLNILEAIRIINPKIRFYQASTSEMFGKVQEIPQSETTPFYPRSPYGVAKLYAHWITINYRESYDIFATSGILFNHESPLRGLEFVTRKITNGLAKVKQGKQSHIELGNLDSQRDWGFAKDYVEGMWLMLQALKPDNYILATGETNTIRHFVDLTCKALNIKLEWKGKGVNEVGIDILSNKEIITINPAYYRPAEVDLLIGNPSKAKKELNWKNKTSLEKLCQMMVDADMQRVTMNKNF